MTDSPIGCHGLVWTGTFDRSGIEDAARRTAQAGFDLIEYPLMEPEGFDAGAAREAVQRNGLAVTASLGLPEHADVSSTDPEVVAAGVRLLGTALDRTSEMGGEHLCGVLYGSMRKHDTPMSEQGWSSSVSALRDLAERAAGLGVHVSLEVVNRYESNMLNTGRQALGYLDQVGHDNLRVHLDTYHMNIEESDAFASVLDVGDRLGYVHIGESHRGYLGTGSVDFGSTFRALRRIGYTGPVVFESFSSAVVSDTLSTTLGIWRNLWTDGDDLGAHANRFIRDARRAVETIDLH